jgi:hypothetical protein
MSNVTLTTKQRNKIKRSVKALNDVRQELQKDNADCDVQWYLEDSDNLNLMSGDPHDDSGRSEGGHGRRQDRVIDTFYLELSSGGGW